MSEEIVATLREFESALLADEGTEALGAAERLAELAADDGAETRALRAGTHAARDRGASDPDDRETFAAFLSDGVGREAGRSVAVTRVLELLLAEERPDDDRIRQVVDDAVEAVGTTADAYESSREAATDRVSGTGVPPTVSVAIEAVPDTPVVEERADVELAVHNVGDDPLTAVDVHLEARGDIELMAADDASVSSVEPGDTATVTPAFTPADTGELSLSVVATVENAGSDVVLTNVEVVEGRERESRSDRDDGGFDESALEESLESIRDSVRYAGVAAGVGTAGLGLSYGAYRYMGGSDGDGSQAADGDREADDGGQEADENRSDDGSR